jgi:hypothetical protein
VVWPQVGTKQNTYGGYIHQLVSGQTVMSVQQTGDLLTAVTELAARPLLPFVARIRDKLPSWGNPIAAGTSGLVVQAVAPSNADTRLTWSEGNVAYAVWGHTESAIVLARSLVHVKG